MIYSAWEETVTKVAPLFSAEANAVGCLLQIYPLAVSRSLINLTEARITVGRGDDAGLCIPDTSVSRNHAIIERREDHYQVSDLGSTNGTCVNEERVASARLESGDRIQFGGCIFKFLSSDHIELQYHEAVYSMMTRDGLTGTLNKRYFLDIIEREFERARHRGTPLALIMFDIDHFKKVNDSYGHLAGDEVLKEIGKRIGTVVAEHDIFARYGGEEFAILLPGVTKQEATKVAERCRAAVEARPFPTTVAALPITISVGVAECTALPSAVRSEQLIEAADQCLYAAKRSGRNQVCD